MWIPSHTGNERADEAAKNALEEYINDRELYPPQDLINWMKSRRKVDTGRKHHEIQKGNYRVEGRLNQPKQKGASGGIHTKDRVHTSNT
jgi:hypothetical protein